MVAPTSLTIDPDPAPILMPLTAVPAPWPAISAAVRLMIVAPFRSPTTTPASPPAMVPKLSSAMPSVSAAASASRATFTPMTLPTIWPPLALAMSVELFWLSVDGVGPPKLNVNVASAMSMPLPAVPVIRPLLVRRIWPPTANIPLTPPTMVPPLFATVRSTRSRCRAALSKNNVRAAMPLVPPEIRFVLLTTDVPPRSSPSPVCPTMTPSLEIRAVAP